MPSSYTASARFVLQATGEGTNVWGSILNNGAFQLIDFAINGVVAISSSGATTLTTANGSADQARAAGLNYTGATEGTLTIPSVSKSYWVRAATANCIVTNGSNSVTVYAGELTQVCTNGTSVWKLVPNDFPSPTRNSQAATKAYVDAQAFQSVNLPGQAGNSGKWLRTVSEAAGWEALPVATAADFIANAATVDPINPDTVWDAAAPVTLAYAATKNLDFSTFLNGEIALTGNVTFTFSNAKPGQSGAITISQDATGNRVATWPAEFFFAANIDLLSTGASKIDELFYYIKSPTRIICSLIKDPV